MFIALDAIGGLPQPPFVATEESGIFNFRDIGGYPIKDNPSLSFRRNLMYRASDPGRITAEGEDQVRALGIKIIFDIRLPVELPQPSQNPANKENAIGGNADTGFFGAGIKEIAGIERRHIDPSKYDSDDLEEGDKDSFTRGFKDFPKFTTERFLAKAKGFLDRGAAFRPIFEHLLQSNPDPFLVHCTAGKDRTGMLVMLLQSLAGVPREFIVEEYALSDRGMRMTAPEIVKVLTRNPELPMPKDWATGLVLAKKEYMEGLVNVLEREHGGVEKYLVENMGLSKYEQECIRENLISEAKPIYMSGMVGQSRSWSQDWWILGVAVGCVLSLFPLAKFLHWRLR